MFSRAYSSCSSLKTCLTKNCWSCSLAKLMHSCSKLQQFSEARGKTGWVDFSQFGIKTAAVDLWCLVSHRGTLTCSCWSSQSQRCQVSQLTAGPLQNPLISCKWQRWFCPRPKGKVFHKWPGSRTERSWLIIHSNTKKKINPHKSQMWSLWTGILVVLTCCKGLHC